MEQMQPTLLPSVTWGWRIEVTLVMALAGLMCLILAQQSILQSRWPVTPLALYLVGIPLLLPLAVWAGDQRVERSLLPQGNSGSDVQKPAGRSLSPYWIAGVFFLLVAVVMGLPSPGSVLFGAAWLLGVGCFLIAGLGLNGGAWAQGWTAARRSLNRIEVGGLVATMVLAALLHWVAPGPQTRLPSHDVALNGSSLVTETTGPLYSLVARGATDLSGLQRISGILAVLIIPVTYLLGRRLDGWQTGALAAGLVSVSGWTLALGKSGEAFPALAVMGGLVILSILPTPRSQRAWGVSGVIIGIAALVSPLAVGLSLLLPLAAVVSGMNDSSAQSLGGRGAAMLRALSQTVLPVVIGAAVALPIWVLPRTAVPTLQTDYETGLNRGVLLVESGASAVLMFNLTGDPNPLHGLADRPAFGPVLAAAFIVGMTVLAAQWGSPNRKLAQLILIGLAVALIPSALLIEPPYRYPDLQRAAAALPVGAVIAGYGLAQILKLIQARLGVAGLALAAAPLAVALALTAGDAIQHYTDKGLPGYEQAAFSYWQLAQPPR
jgi:hypothetical protein